jgi:hypothetical protein
MGEGFLAALWVGVTAVTLAIATSPFVIWYLQ